MKEPASSFKASGVAAASLGAVRARREAIGASAGAKLTAAGSTLQAAAAGLKATLPTEAKQASVLAKETVKLGAESNPSIPGLFDKVSTLANRASELVTAAKEKVESVVDDAKQVATRGLELLQKGKEQLERIASDVKKGADELKKTTYDTTIDQPIDKMKPGSEVTIDATHQMQVNGEVINGKGQAQRTVKVKADDDGGYTVRVETSANVAVGAGAKVKQVDVSGDVGVGGTVTQEYKVKPVMVMKDGKEVVDVEATKKKAKQLTELLANPRVENAAVAGVGLNMGPKDTRTPAEKRLMDESYVATEYKGQIAQTMAEQLGLPNVGNAGANQKGTGDLMVRIENGQIPVRDRNGKPVLDEKGQPTTQPGTKVTTSTTLAVEFSEQGTVNPESLQKLADPTRQLDGPNGKELDTRGLDSKQSGKVTIAQSYEVPNGDFTKLGTDEAHVTTTATVENEIQATSTNGKQGDLIVVKGGAKDGSRVGGTNTVTITFDGNTSTGDVVKNLQKGDVVEAAKSAGKQAQIKVQSTLYEERTRSVEVGYDVFVANSNSKLELVERHPIKTTTVVDADATTLARKTKKQLQDARKELERQRENPLLAES